MGSREIITFQIGNYSNYVGAHWWNIQESCFQYDDKHPSEVYHDVLFREGKTLRGHVTFTPRLILLDKSENVANAPILTESPVKSQSVGTSDGKSVSVQEQQIPEKHEFIKDLEKIDEGQRIDVTKKDYNFEDTVRTWNDFLRTKYHPKSVCTFRNDFPTDVFHSGSDIYKILRDDFEEKVRSYMEECDNLQGFQMIVDAADAFAGFASFALQHLQDEYSAKTVVTFPVIPGQYSNATPIEDVKRTVNIFLAYQKLTEYTSLLVPLGTNTSAWRGLGPPTEFPNLIYNHTNAYQTSAILASFLDTVSLKHRLRYDYNHLHDLVSGLNYYNKKVCAASMSLPFPIAPDSYLLDTLENLDDTGPLWSQLTPGCNINDDTIFFQRITVRGISLERLRNPSLPRQNSRAYSCSSVEELIHLYLSYRLTTISDVTSTKLPLKTLVPYPRIFSPHVSPTGAVDNTATRVDGFDVGSCPSVTGLHCCKGVARMLDSLHCCVKAINIKRFHQFFGGHMDYDEFNECLEKLLEMGHNSANDLDLR